VSHAVLKKRLPYQKPFSAIPLFGERGRAFSDGERDGIVPIKRQG
jgi:hypothetical protein